MPFHRCQKRLFAPVPACLVSSVTKLSFFERPWRECSHYPAASGWPWHTVVRWQMNWERGKRGRHDTALLSGGESLWVRQFALWTLLLLMQQHVFKGVSFVCGFKSDCCFFFSCLLQVSKLYGWLIINKWSAHFSNLIANFCRLYNLMFDNLFPAQCFLKLCLFGNLDNTTWIWYCIKYWLINIFKILISRSPRCTVIRTFHIRLEDTKFHIVFSLVLWRCRTTKQNLRPLKSMGLTWR